MTARTGAEYQRDLEDSREVWLGREKVSVTAHPAFAGSILGMAGYFDWQHEHAADCLVEDEVTGQPMSASLIVPKNHEDLARRRRGLDRLARYSYGMLGRTPDYLNVVLSGHVARSDIYGKGDPVFHERIRRYHREVIEGDRSLTHTIIHATIDKSVGEFSGINEDLTLRVVSRNKNGIVVRGAKVLATLAPFADDIFVYPAGRPLRPEEGQFALAFAIPMATKGLKTICRDHYGIDAPVEDLPFSSRFDEQDAFMIFDDVEVPWERVFIDGNLDVHNTISGAVSPGNTAHQTAIRACVKLEFAYDLCTEMARITGTDTRPDVMQMLGEIWTYLTLARAMVSSAEARAYDWGAGAFFPHNDLSALRNVMPDWMVRINDIIQMMGSHNLLATPSIAAFAEPEIGPLLKKYLPAARGITPEDRARIMRTAWDFAGSALGARVELYERFYLGSQPRNYTNAHLNAQRGGGWGQVRELISRKRA